jgi:hypothetical protein
LTEQFGSIKIGFEALFQVELFTSSNLTKQNMEATGGFQIVNKKDNEYETFNLKHVENGYVSNRGGNLLICVGAFSKPRSANPILDGVQYLEQAFKIPSFLAGRDKRQKTEDYIVSSFGSFRRAGEVISGRTFPDRFMKSPDTAIDRLRYWRKDDLFQLMEKTSGAIVPSNDFYANLGLALTGYPDNASSTGWDAVFDYFVGNDISVILDPAAVAKRERQDEDRRKKRELQNKRSKETAMEIVSSAIDYNEGILIYEEYIQQGREQLHFEAFNMSKHIMVVHELAYNNPNDAENDKRKFTAIILPLTKKDASGDWKVCGLHAVYLERTSGVWDKADIDLPKKDLSTWSDDTGMLSNMSTCNGNDVLYVGEGNETIASFFGALLEPVMRKAEELVIAKTQNNGDFGGGCFQNMVKSEALGLLDFDVKFSNTATRLQTAEISDYDEVNLIVDRDRSGAGMRACMIQRHKLEEDGVIVNFILPPSLRVPIFIYLNDYVEATSLKNCIMECDYWRKIDLLLERDWLSAGKEYKSRYESFIVIPDNYQGYIDSIDYPHLIKQSDIDKDIVPKGVDWDDAIKLNPGYAFEVDDLMYRLEQKQLAKQAVA